MTSEGFCAILYLHAAIAAYFVNSGSSRFESCKIAVRFRVLLIASRIYLGRGVVK